MEEFEKSIKILQLRQNMSKLIILYCVYRDLKRFTRNYILYFQL